MMFAPDWTVAPEVSPFVPLPVLDLCAHCGGAEDPLAICTVLKAGVMHGPLCRGCAV